MWSGSDLFKEHEMSPVTRPRVLIGADSRPAAEEYTGLLEPEFEVVGTLADEELMISRIFGLKPDVLVLDCSVAWVNGTESRRVIKKLARTVRIVYLNSNAGVDIASDEPRGGIYGYLLKSEAASKLVFAVRAVLRGERYPSLPAAGSIEKSADRGARATTGQGELTDRQREVLKLLAEGRTMKEIAYILVLTPRTIAFHKYMMMERLQLRTNAELIQYAIQQNIIASHS
jgi:DNA-binding NarL/FixJ family response regulator